MKENIIGREQEKDLLQLIYASEQAEFVAVYGRLHVGKTFLIREYFENEIVFQVSGLANSPTNNQVKNFYQALKRYNRQLNRLPSDWFECFELLIDYLEQLPHIRRKVIFLDEIPWMDTSGSNFITALEHFWNSRVSSRHDIVLIVSGSTTSWMQDKLISNHGVLGGRLTHQILLSALTLGESKAFLQQKNILFSDYEIAQAYMILGGIPYYLNMFDKRLNLAQNIDRLLFNPNGVLYNEFYNLYRSLFKDSESYIKVIKILNTRGNGLTRQEISELSGIKSGRPLTEVINNLEACGFIHKYQNYGCSVRKTLYQLVDFYTLFYFRFLTDCSFYNMKHWNDIQQTDAFYQWAEISFEMLSTLHIDNIKKRLGIYDVASAVYSWRSSKQAAEYAVTQIALVIERGDNTINICEIKFSEDEFTISAAYEKNLRNKINSFSTETKNRKSLQLTMVTTYGLHKNQYAGIVQNEVTLADLFL